MYDLGIATRNLCLAALGPGAVIVGLFDYDRAVKTLTLPRSMTWSPLIPIGHSAETFSALRRKEIGEFTPGTF